MTNTTLAPEAPTAPPSAAPPAAHTRAAMKIYGAGGTEVVALGGIDVDFATGEFTAIMGPSGSGKSTLMHCAAGLDQLTSGSAYIGDVELGSLTERELTMLRRDQVGFVFQAFNLVPTLTASENISLPLDLAGRRADPSWWDHVVETVGLADRLDHRPDQLSGGQQQRVAVARALVGQPSIVFADEPTGNLDSNSGAEILEFMRHAVRTMGRTIVMVTHDPVAAAYADRVVFLSDGEIRAQIDDPTPSSVLDRMRSLDGAPEEV